MVFGTMDEQFEYVTRVRSGEQRYAVTYVYNFHRYMACLPALSSKFSIKSQMLMHIPVDGHNYKGLLLGRQGMNTRAI